ncbi:MAG: hypothetical protein HW394_1107, partial [Acidobacteria bacterium]|nr:hypothetical protein [Acidobacteriota bacterium]
MNMIKKMLSVVAAVLVLGATAASRAQTTVPSTTQAHVEFLASDTLEGREAGSAGERLAGD